MTPEILIGNFLFDRRSWAKKIEAESAKDAAVVVKTELALKKGKLAATIRLENPRRKLPPSTVVRPVIFQREAVTTVSAGENEGKTLLEYFVVRGVHDGLSARKALEDKGVCAKLALPKGVATKNLGLAVLVEDAKSMTTYEAVVFDLPAKPGKKKGR